MLHYYIKNYVLILDILLISKLFNLDILIMTYINIYVYFIYISYIYSFSLIYLFLLKINVYYLYCSIK